MMTKPILILTGQSGSGKSVALRALEDQGFLAVDNLPVPLLVDLARLEMEGPESEKRSGLAVGIDSRGAPHLDQLPEALAELRRRGYPVQLVYLEASDDVLLARFRFTRRRHPYGFKTSLIEAIQAEKERLSGLRDLADQKIDTTFLEPVTLKSRVALLAGRRPTRLDVLITSFGFKYGNPSDADFTFDTRFLPNPYYVEALRPLCGLDEPVRAFIYNHSETEHFLAECYALFAGVLPHYHQSGKTFVHVAIGCTGGHHRSVFVASWLAQRLEALDGVDVTLRHRDLKRHV